MRGVHASSFVICRTCGRDDESVNQAHCRRCGSSSLQRFGRSAYGPPPAIDSDRRDWRMDPTPDEEAQANGWIERYQDARDREEKETA